MNPTTLTKSALFSTPTTTKLTAAEERHRKEQATKHKSKKKKKKLRWKDKVTPQPPKEEPREQVIDEECLTQCSRCPRHRNRKGTFRPLIGNGEYLCDACYQSEFPCTAMTEENNRPLKRMSNATNIVRNMLSDTAADIKGVATTPGGRTDKAITSNIEDFPSEIECRSCLERGLYRRCCSEYYCHVCYHRQGQCPGCQADVPITGLAREKPDPGMIAVGISWAVSILLVFITFVGVALVYYNGSTTPTTVWGHSCRGWLQVCDLNVCLDYDGDDGYGESGGSLPAAQPYKVCDRNTTTNQVVASACVFDTELYAWSNNLLGYDLCVSSPREESSRPRNVSESNPLLLYSEDTSGVYVFDDDFEDVNKASPWSEIINGEMSDACGFNTRPPEGGNQSNNSTKALVFTGFNTRQAVTTYLDLTYGGRVEFYLKMGPISYGMFNTECKTAYSDVIIEYRASVDTDWTTFGVYQAYHYRGSSFKFISVDIPIETHGNTTQIRFRQPSFDALRDHWALDDVRIYSKLKPLWQESVEYRDRKEEQDENVLFAQCCYNTDQCSVFDKARLGFDFEDCDKRLPEFNTSLRRGSRLKIYELFIFYLCLAAISKMIYHLVAERFINRSKASEDKATCQQQGRGNDELFPRRSFFCQVQVSWQCLVASILSGALICTLYRLLDSLASNTDGTFIVCCFIAAMFDIKAIGMLLSQVFGIQCPWCKPLVVEIDLHPDQGTLQVGSEIIPLSDVSDIKSQTTAYCWVLSLLHIISGLPLALASLTLSSFDLLPSLEVCSSILGCLAIIREVFGVSFVVKFYLAIQWMLTRKLGDRDELGRAIQRKGLLQFALIGTCFSLVFIFGTITGRRVDEDVSTGDNFLLFLMCLFLGGLFGFVLGIVRGIPVHCEGRLSSWPCNCTTVSFHDRAVCPCLFSCGYCTSMHSRHVLLVIALDDVYTFKRILRGNNNLKKAEI